LSASDKTKLDALPMAPTAITSTTTAGTSPALYLCSPSSSNIDVDLPAASGNSGLRIGVKMVNSSSGTRTVTIDANGSDTIDGAASVVLYVDNDYVEVQCDGSDWWVIVDGRLGHEAIIRRSSAQSISNNTVTTISFDNVERDFGNIATTGTTPITIRREGFYLFSASINLTGIDDQERLALRIAQNGSYRNYVDTWASGNDRELAVNLTVLLRCASGDTIDMRVYHNEGGSLNTSTTDEDEPRLSVMEVMPFTVNP
jgi:hypothetical protein